MAAEEASSVGINLTFAPMVDIARDARWGRVMEGAGEDPYLGSLIAKARIQGFQGNQGFQGHTGPIGPIGGTNTQILFNQTGIATGSSNLTYNYTNNMVTLPNVTASSGSFSNLLVSSANIRL